LTLWLAIGVFGLTGFLYFARKKVLPAVEPSLHAQPFARRSIAVIGLRNLSGSPVDSWLSTGLAEMLSTELASSERLRVISGEEVARAGLSDPPANTPSHASLIRYGNQLGADMIVFGSYTVQQHLPDDLPDKGTDKAADKGPDRATPQIRLDLRVEDLSADGPGISMVKTGRMTDLFSLVSASGSDLRRHFGFEEPSLNAATAVRRTLPSDPEAARLYAEGLSHLRNFDPVGGSDLLFKADKIEPGHAGTHLALADAWHAMGYAAEARAEATRAVELGAGLPREEVLTMQGELAVLSGDWPRAMDIYHSLLVLYPDDIDLGLRLVVAQSGANRYVDAAATLKDLRRPGMAHAEEAKLDLSEATIHSATGDFRQSVVDADKATVIAAELENHLLRAEALGVKAFSLEQLGDSQGSIAASLEAQNLYRAAHDKRGLAVSLILSGDVLYDQGKTGDARRNFLASLALFREIGNRINEGLSLERVGNTYYREAALVDSRKNYQQALAIYRELHAVDHIGGAIGNIANVQETEGDLAGALASNAECLALAEKAGNKSEVASTLSNMGVLETERGHLELASSDFERAVALDRQMKYARGLAYAQLGQGDVLLERNDISGALRRYELAAKAIEGMDEPEVRIPSLIGLGTAHLLSGNANQAAPALAQAAEMAVKNKEHWLATVSLVWLSRALLVQGHLPEALRAARDAGTEAQAESGPQGRALALFALARVLVAQGKRSEAQEPIRSALAMTQRHGYGPLDMDLRIVFAETLTDARGRRTALDALERDARTHGWHRLAADARRARMRGDC
jgi:tetratricopeptide (TPR) repeat protein